MKRWHTEIELMRKRWKVEREKHRLDGNVNCHCLRGPGTMRKRRPWGCCRSRCKLCHPWKHFSKGTGRQNWRLWALRWEEIAWGTTSRGGPGRFQ